MPDGRSCNVCGSAGFERIYRSRSRHSLTSLCQLRPGGVEVFFCGDCGHLGSNVLADIEAFYKHDYKILIDSDEEDQIYETRGEAIVYRTDHQMDVLTRKHAIAPDARVLDYGCAKAEMSRRLKQAHPGIDLHLFDVSHMYKSWWDRLVDDGHQAIHTTPTDWAGRLDLVTSYFAFEHIPKPAVAARHVAELLRPGGTFYAVVPDTFGNIADFIVADHVNHFTRPSLIRLLRDAGFGAIAIDAEAHRGAFVVVARKEASQATSQSDTETVATIGDKARELAAYWRDAEARLREQEQASGSSPAAIYGAGFYGAFILSHLDRPEAIRCFVDRNPFQQGRALFDTPITAPEDLPDEIETLYVGLNPAIARTAMAASPLMDRPALTARFLDQGR